MKNYARQLGEKNGFSKLTAHDVRLIRELLSAGLKLRVIAEKFEVSIPAISDIKHGRRWAHV